MAKKPRNTTSRKKHHSSLKPRQRKLLKGVASGLTITEAGKAAGYSHPNAASRAFKTIRLRFHPALVEAGYDVGKLLVQNFEDIWALKKAKETKFFPHNGIVRDQKEVDAHDIQLRAAVEINKVLGVTGNGRDEPNGADVPTAPIVTLLFTDREHAARFSESLARFARYPVQRVNGDEGRAGSVPALEAGPAASTSEDSGRPEEARADSVNEENSDHDYKDLLGDYPPGMAPDYDPTAI